MPRAPQVPEYVSQTRPNELPGERFTTEAPIEAFGGGRANQQAAARGEAVGEISKAFSEEYQKAQQVEFQRADGMAAALQTQLQVKTSQMLGRDAGGASEYAQGEWEKGISEIQQGLKGHALDAFNKSSQERWSTLDHHVELHMSQQAQATDQAETKAYVDTAVDQIRTNPFDAKVIHDSIDRIHDATTANASRLGELYDKEGGTSPVYTQRLLDATSGAHKAVVEGRLAIGKNDLAKQYFDEAKAKGQINSADMQYLEKRVEDSVVIGEGLKAWDQYKGFKLADGSPDEAKIRDSVLKNTDISDQRKEKVWAFVKARMGESIVDEHRQDASRDRFVENNVLEGKKQGQTLTDAIKFLYSRPGLFKDPHDEAVKLKMIQDIYAPPTKSDPETELSLYEGIGDKTTTKEDIQNAYIKGQLGAGQFIALSKKRDDEYNKEGRADLKAADAQIKADAKKKFGSNKDEFAKYLNAVNLAGENKSPEEKIEIAKKLLPTSHWFSATERPYSDINSRVDASAKAWATANDQLGQGVVDAITKGQKALGRQKLSPPDIQNFANEFGGYGGLVKGQPANNAIQSLMRDRKTVTVRSVQQVLKDHPDGNFPSGWYK